MDKIKFLEIRDEGTTIPAFAFRPIGQFNSQRKWIAQRAGFVADSLDETCVVFGNLNCGGRVEYDPYAWGDSRTMATAHKYISENFNFIPDGSVVDVQFILGETSSPKESDRFWEPE